MADLPEIAPADPIRPMRAPAVAWTFAKAMLVPVAVTLLAAVPYLAIRHLDGDDRAIVWIVGDDAATHAAVSAVESQRVFVGGGTRLPQRLSGAGAVPAGCPAAATRLHFDVRRVDEAQTARAILEQLAVSAGAGICATNLFELNRVDDSWRGGTLLVGLLLSISLLAAVRLSPATAAAIPRLAQDPLWRRSRGGVVLLLAAALLPVMLAAGGDVGFAALLTMTLQPVVHEIAFRGWLPTVLERTTGAPLAAAVSFAASVVSALPAPPTTLAQTALVAAACALAWLRLRSLSACIALHVGLAALPGAWNGA